MTTEIIKKKNKTLAMTVRNDHECEGVDSYNNYEDYRENLKC